MFNLTIINSARFIKMPMDAQNLYFHLGLRADDDGVVEAFTVMRLIGSPEDNLKLLHAKGFVRILNEDLVTYITDWKEHNLIRADRKIDSVYKELLIQIIPDVELLESKERADRKQDDDGTSQGQPKDGIGKVRLGEDRLVKINYADNVLLLEKEYETLVRKYGEESTKAMITKLDNYKLAHGKKYKSDYGAINSWVADEVLKQKAEQPKRNIIM